MKFDKDKFVEGPGYWMGLIFCVVFCLGVLGVFGALMLRVTLWAWAGLL